jgi:hypothetical protein
MDSSNALFVVEDSLEKLDEAKLELNEEFNEVLDTEDEDDIILSLLSQDCQ